MPSSPFEAFLASGDDRADGAPVVAGRFDGEHILVPLLTGAVPVLTDQLKVATTLARETGASVTVINPLTVAEQPAETYRRDATDDDDAAPLERVFEHATESLPEVDGDLVYARNVVRGVRRAVGRREVDTLVVPGRSSSTRLRAGVTEQLAAHADADIVVVNGRAGFRDAASILLPVAGGPHSGLAADVAAAVAADRDAWIDVLHVVDEDAADGQRGRAEDLVEEVARRIDRPETTTTWVLEATDTVDAIVEQSRYYDLTILGAPTKGRLRQLIFGSTNGFVRANAESVVLSARNNAPRSDAE
jgi:nucleotide-binding universal stress UspA family protein